MNFYQELIKRAEEAALEPGKDGASPGEEASPQNRDATKDPAAITQNIRSLISEIDAMISSITQGATGGTPQPAQAGAPVPGVATDIPVTPAPAQGDGKTISITMPSAAEVKVASEAPSNLDKIAGLIDAASYLFDVGGVS